MPISKNIVMQMKMILNFYVFIGCLLVLMIPICASAQETKSITGYVLDNTGEPLIGASVMVKDTNYGVITDVDGKFTLNAPSDAVLSFSYIGFTPKEISLAKRKRKGEMRVRLMETHRNLRR